MKDFRIIVLAAGKGVRMKSALPKVLHPVCGKPMIGYTIELAQSLGSLKTYVVVGHQGGMVRKYLPKDARVIIQKRLLGTADAIRSVLPAMKQYSGNLLVVCADTPLLKKETIKDLLKKHRQSKAACTILTAVMERPGGYGRIIRSGGQVIAIREEKDAAFDEKAVKEINTGVYCFHAPSLIRSISAIRLNSKKKEFYLTDIIGLLAEKGETVETVTTDDAKEAAGINTREDLAFAESVVRKRILSKFMLQGVTIVDPDNTYIEASATIGRDTTIRPFTIIEQNVKIGRRCSLGPFCRIRPDTHIGDDVQIGNFTEVSRSTLGNKTFMKHFSFVGDSVVGRNVNIGAGVVTANYDGKNKNVTRIGDHSFIGSDSVLIAPLKMGKRVVTGAGAVVTKGTKVPDGTILAGVPAKTILRRKKTP